MMFRRNSKGQKQIMLSSTDKCNQYQKLSCLLKTDRASSHPERQIGKSKRTVLESEKIDIAFLQRVLLNYIEYDLAEPPHVHFFALSLLLDWLKTESTLENIIFAMHIAEVLLCNPACFASASVMMKMLNIFQYMSHFGMQFSGFSRLLHPFLDLTKLYRAMSLAQAKVFRHTTNTCKSGSCSFIDDEPAVNTPLISTFLVTTASVLNDILKFSSTVTLDETNTTIQNNNEECCCLAQMFIDIFSLCLAVINDKGLRISLKLLSENDSDLTQFLLNFLELQLR